MIIALHNPGIDATDIDSRGDRRAFRTLAVDLDLTIELGEFSVGGAEKLMDRKSNSRMRLIEFVGFIRERDRTQKNKDAKAKSN